jgi:hypothetical protein
MKPQAAVQPTTDATVLEENYHRTPTALGHQLEDLLRVVTTLVALAAVAPWWLMATPVKEAAAVRAPHTGLEGEPVAEAIAEAEATQTATSLVSHAAATMPAVESKKFDARNPPRQVRTMASPPSPLDFAICCSRRNSSLSGSPSTIRSKIQYSGSDAMPSPSRNASGNNDTKCLYFPFCLDQAPLTWLESLEKYSIDKWDHLKEQFSSNFAGAMGRSSTRMDQAMVKQEQGETLHKYMRCFFDKRATLVDVTDK